MDASPSIMDHVRLRPDSEIVEVRGVLTSAGAPLPVRCEKPDRLEMARLMRALPGERPAQVSDRDSPNDEEAFLTWAPQLIEKWTAVELPDGSWQRPAFSFAEETPAGLIPGRELTFVDVSNLAVTLMRLGGYLGGAATEAFSRQRGRGGDGNGAVAAG